MTREQLLTEYDRFLRSRQEALKLEIALAGYAELCLGVDAEVKHTYSVYLKKRIRPAVQQIAIKGNAKLLDVMWQEQVLTAPVLPELLKREEIQNCPAVWVRLLRLHHRESLKKEQSEVQDMDQRNVSCVEAERVDCRYESRTRSDVACKMLAYSRAALYEAYPFLDAAAAALAFQESSETETIGTDGMHLFYNREFVISAFREDPAFLTGLYLHQLLHCIFRHWACRADGVEQDFFDAQIADLIRGEQIRNVKCASIVKLSDVWKDDHHFWPDFGNKEEMEKVSSVWDTIMQRIGSGNGAQGASFLGIGSISGSQVDLITDLKRSGYDYRSFLKSFAVRREEMELDQESFDYIYYSLGMDTYGDMPLIEPLEYKEGHKLEELVIAIDTSGSCSLDQVRRFLEESYQILCEKENFFRRMKVYIIQCDCTIQDVALIKSEEDWTMYCKDLKIYGRSGTNFKPVFQYVDQLIEKGELKNLKGLIYFTDGNGTFPTWKPAYQSAFVFVNKDMGLEKLPPWALQLELPKETIV